MKVAPPNLADLLVEVTLLVELVAEPPWGHRGLEELWGPGLPLQVLAVAHPPPSCSFGIGCSQICANLRRHRV